MREEVRARKEIEKARQEAEKEETRYQEALDKARQEFEQALDTNKEILSQRIQQLEKQLAKATDDKEQAIYRARMSKSGHVYVVSNVGSFGENVYRIGVTQRLDPYDSISNLGASVPFPFDVHAMIFSEDPIEMESLLHQRFEDRRVNMVNDRKEFFRVSLEEIKKAAKEIAEHTGTVKREIQFTMAAPAEEYRRTQAIARHQSSRW